MSQDIESPKAAQQVPRAEYPRPQFQRNEWLCLNGEWCFAFDDADAGLAEGWVEQFSTESPEGRIVVPFAYQSRLSGIGDRTIHPVIWYRRTLDVPEAWRGRRVRLHFGAVDFKTDVWLNGQHLGSHVGGYTPFSFDISTALGLGGSEDPSTDNVLVVRCEDWPTEEQPRGKQDGEAHRAYQFTATSGIWQTVWLEPIGASEDGSYLVSCRIVPDLAQGGFHLRPEMGGTRADGRAESGATETARSAGTPGRMAGLRLEVDASLDGTPVGQIAVACDPNGDDTSGFIALSERRLWSPDTPALYDLRLRLFDGETLVDDVLTYAGLREVTVRGRDILLNGEPIYQRQVLDQGYWPDGIYTAPSDTALRADVEWTKRLGFNGARKHQKVEDPRWLYWCDRLGLLVWDEMASNYQDSPRAREWLRAEWRDVVRRDVNHPCIVAWVPFNETWGVRELLTDVSQQAHVAAVVADTRAIDATRPVVDNSGWTHVDTDIADSHHYEPDPGLFLTAWHAFHSGDDPQRGRVLRSWDGNHGGRRWYGAGYAKRLFAEGYEYAGQPILVSEWGGFFLEGMGEVAPILRERRGVEPDEAAFLARYEKMIVAFDSLPDLVGDCWTQLTDIEDEPNGLLTEDRQPKVDVDRIAAINRRRFRA
jgi:hypothetical protein